MDTRSDFQKRIGVGEPSRAFSLQFGTTRTRQVLREEGPNAGSVGGVQVDHWNGRMDATVYPDVVRHTRAKEST
jgi:hypothetical protein